MKSTSCQWRSEVEPHEELPLKHEKWDIPVNRRHSWSCLVRPRSLAGRYQPPHICGRLRWKSGYSTYSCRSRTLGTLAACPGDWCWSVETCQTPLWCHNNSIPTESCMLARHKKDIYQHTYPSQSATRYFIHHTQPVWIVFKSIAITSKENFHNSWQDSWVKESLLTDLLLWAIWLSMYLRIWKEKCFIDQQSASHRCTFQRIRFLVQSIECQTIFLQNILSHGSQNIPQSLTCLPQMSFEWAMINRTDLIERRLWRGIHPSFREMLSPQINDQEVNVYSIHPLVDIEEPQNNFVKDPEPSEVFLWRKERHDEPR